MLTPIDSNKGKMRSGLSVALDVRGTGQPEPRGIVTLQQQYARACALLADSSELNLCFYGGEADRVWLVNEGLLNSACFRRYSFPMRIEYLGARLGFQPLPLALGYYDLYHTFGTYVTTKPVRTIGTLVDFVPMRLPEFVPISHTIAQAKWCQWAEKQHRARWVAISYHVKQDALQLGRLRSEQVEVAYPCVSLDTITPLPPKSTAAILESYGISQPYLLYVSTLNPRKNHQRLVEAWQKGGFAFKGWNLVLAGKPAGNPLVDLLQADKFPGIKWLDYVSKSELSALYEAAEACLYPSLYEGFGIPVADAVVAGKPILTSQRSPMAEIAGEGAIYVDPWDVDDIMQKLDRLISDMNLRTRLAEYNKLQAMNFSIERLANDLLNIYSKFSREMV